MIRVLKITLKPNNKQRSYLSKASGWARFANNWGFNEWQDVYKSGNKPNESAIRRSLNAIKHSQFKRHRKYQKSCRELHGCKPVEKRVLAKGSSCQGSETNFCERCPHLINYEKVSLATPVIG